MLVYFYTFSNQNKKDVPLPRWLNEEGMCVRVREDLVLHEALGNSPQMHVLFSRTKLWMIAMGLSKELPSKIFTLVQNITRG